MSDNSDETKLIMRNGKLERVKMITRVEADKLDNFAQGLDDPITHVVDYGGVEDDIGNKNKRKK